MSSPWAIPQHGVDVGGYIPNGGGPPSPIGGGASSPGGASNKSRRSIANWFSRSRSTSPAAAEDNNGRYSRQASPTSFVVRSVVKQPGGVSYESSNRSPGPHSPNYQQQGGEDYISSQQHNAAYSRERSRPLHSLSVPAGGPGGGTGYGTATSPNDGRPLIEQEGKMPPPTLNGTSTSPQTSPGRGRSIDRPASPGAISAGAFRRGRSGSNTGGTPSSLVPGQGAGAGAASTGRGGGKPAATMISPGPQSWRQAAEARESERATPSSSTAAAPRISSTSPGGPRQNPNNNRFSMMNHAERKPAPIDTNLGSSGDYHEAMRARIAQAGGAMPLGPDSMAASTRTPPAVIPMPIDMPATNSNNNRRPSPHAYEHSPLGPSSPARNNNNNGGRRTSFGAGPNEDEGMVSPAAQWIKGLFSKSPRQSQSPSPSPGTSPMPYAMRDGLSPAPTTPYAWTDGSPLAGPRKSNQTQKYDHDEDEVVLRGDGDEVEAEALARKRHSMRIAARIEDEHRNRLMQGGTQPVENNLPKPWSPRQAIDSGDEEENSLPKSRSPPGRKPVPKLDMEPTAEELRRMSLGQRERVAKGVDPENQLSKQADMATLTPAQQIIAETRSRHLSRERQEQHKKDPSSSSSQRHPPTLPSKSPHPSVRRANEEKSEQPQQTQQQSTPVKGKSAETPAAATASKNAANNGLLPGQGPMPSSMPMGEALQEMMVRFYRFERYAVPLMRAIEGRVLDIEKDAQMAQNAAAAGLAADDSRSAKSARDAEMDKWVGQMTGLIKHEIGQLRAATAELRGGRELLAAAAGIGGGVNNASVSPNAKVTDTAKPSTAIASATEAAASEQKPQSASPMKSGEAEKDNRRHNNISSTSFISAVPRRGSMQRQQEELNAKLGAGARPVSPSGRPRYTSALGQPLQNGRLSPVRGGSTSSRNVSASEQNDEDDDGKSDVSSASRAQSIDERLKALVNNKIRTPSSQTSSSDAVMVEHDDAVSSSGMNRTSSDADGFALVSSKTDDDDDDEQPHTPLRRNRQKEASAVSAKSEATFVPSSNVAFPSPSPSPSDIQTSGFASQGLRARAQSYLQHAESRSSLSNSSSSLVSTPRSPAARSKEPSPSPAPPNESDWLARKKSAASSTSSSSSTRPLTIKKSVNSLSSASATSPVKESFGSTLNSRKVAGPKAEEEDKEEEESENAGQATIRAKKSPVSSAFLNHQTSSTLSSSSSPKKRTPILTSSSSPATTPGGGTTSFRDRIAFFDAAAR